MALGNMISPGVYTNIIDLSEYLQDVPGTVGFIPLLSKKGPDNKLMMVTSNEQFYTLYGQPNITDYNKYYGQGPYIASQHLAVSSHLYVLRALPQDATYSHLMVGMQVVDYVLNTTYSSSSSGFNFSVLEMQPLFFDGQNHVYDGGGSLSYTVSGGVIVSSSVSVAGSASYIDGSYAITVPGSGAVPGVLNYGIAGNTLASTSVKTPGTGYVDGTYTIAIIQTVAYPLVDHVNKLETQLRLEDTTAFMNNVTTAGTGVPYGMLMYFRAIGRGDSYNTFAIQISKYANPEMFGTYVLNIYDKASDGTDQIVESYNVSFDPNAVDNAGESMFIEDVVNKFSTNIRCKVNPDALRQLNLYSTEFYKNDPTLPEWVLAAHPEWVVLDQNGLPTDLGFKATSIEFAKLDYNYVAGYTNDQGVYVKGILDMALDDLTAARAMPTTTSDEIIARNTAVYAALQDVSIARSDLTAATAALNAAYALDIMNLGDSDLATPGVQPWHLQEGSEGSLTYMDQNTGKMVVQPDEATQVLSDAYLGLLVKPDNPAKEDATNGNLLPIKTQYVDEVFDLDWIYFSLVYDAGYNTDVKTSALTLADTYRRDCMLISDCGDNLDYDDCQTSVGGNPNEAGGHPVNSRYAARFEPYSRVYDAFTGRDLWLTPVYHMCQLIPLNDRLYEIWYASAGFNRGTLNTIKELRWSAKLGERDNLYLLQVNPIVHFPEGYTVWGNLTTQKRPTALQDINVMRLVLYIKRALEQFCRYFIFDFNDQPTWDRIKRGIVPFLDTIKARRGLVSYSVSVGATEWEFKNKICHVDVNLTPMKVIEKIELNMYIH